MLAANAGRRNPLNARPAAPAGFFSGHPVHLWQNIRMDQAQPDAAHCVWVNPGQLGNFRQAQIRRLGQHRPYLRFNGWPARALVRLASADLVNGLAGNAKPARNGGTWLRAGADGSHDLG